MKKTLIIIAAASLAWSPAHALVNNDQSTTNAPSASALGIGIGGNATAVGGTGIGIGGGATIEKGAVQNTVHNDNLNLVDVSNRIDNKNTNLNVNGQEQKQEQEMAQLQGQQQQANNAQSQNMTGSNNAKQVVEFKSAKYLPALTSAPVGDTRAPELMLNAEQAMIAAANAEIDAMSSKGFTDGYVYRDHGVAVSVSYTDKEFMTHAYPEGSAKGITPALIDMINRKAIDRLNPKTIVLSQRYVSIENHSNGTGAGLTNSGSLANADRGLVGGIASALTGNRGRTSERVRIELVYVGQR